MILADTHSHLYLEQFDDDLTDVLKRASEAGIRHIFLPAIDWNSLEEMKKMPEGDISFYKMMGIHPGQINGPRLDEEQKLLDYCSKDEIIGVGETGLDYYWSTDYVKDQKESLRMHCRIAKAVNKPIILHNREATDDLLSIIEKEQDGTLTGVWHCFTGSQSEGKRAIDLGLLLGIGGVTTFKNAGVDAVVRKMPAEKLILETDAPYLAPAPKRGKRNEPAFMKFTAEKLAILKEKSLEEISKITTQNAFRLFGLNSEQL